jgi:ribosomal protein L44E
MARKGKPTTKRWFEIECRKCGQRFVEMSKLAFHRCPAEEREVAVEPD